MADPIDAQMRALHDSGAHDTLSRLHEEAASRPLPMEERRFHLTHAWVYALVEGDTARVTSLERELRALGGL
jgi:hypothetical protein